MALIDQQEAIDALNAQAEEMSHWHERYAEQRKGILTAINIVTDIEPTQEIIRCNGCLYKKICSWKREGAKFCSFGERGEKDGNDKS